MKYSNQSKVRFIYSLTSNKFLRKTSLTAFLKQSIIKMTNRAPNSHNKASEKYYDQIIPSSSAQISKKVETFDNIVVMSGTATRKSLEKKGNQLERKHLQKTELKETITKLRAPYNKSHRRQGHSQGKLLTKSCEVLLGCIKPCKDIRVAKKTKVTESMRIGKVLKTTNIIYERKATREVHFFSFSEKNPTIFNMQHPLTFLETKSAENLETEDADGKFFHKTKTYPNETIRTVSSEEFVTKVFPQAETTMVI